MVFAGAGLLRLGAFPGARHYHIEIPGEFKPCNPSIAADGDGFRVLVRTVNYRIDEGGKYRIGPDLETINWLLRLDSGFRLIDAARLDDAEARTSSGLFVRHGFEDGRLFRWRDDWWFTAAAKVSHAPSQFVFALCRLDGSRLAECRFVRSPFGRSVEKNWMPRVAGDELALVYRAAPTQIIHCLSNGKFEFENLGIAASRFINWSGSSQLVPYRGNWLCAVHLCVRKKRPHHYLNAFVEFDRDFRIVRFSAPWVFDAPTIEFCAGLCVAGDDAILGYGVWDREARLLSVPLRVIERMLERGPRALALHAVNGFSRLTAPFFRRDETIAVDETPSAPAPGAA